MAVVLIPNQLVKLYKTTDFNTRNKKLTQDFRQYCQIVKDEQTTMFQVKVTEEGDQMLQNPDFESSLNNWSEITEQWQYSNGQAQAIKQPGIDAVLQQTIFLTANTTYALTVDIGLFSGSVDAYLILNAQNGEQQSIQITRDEFGTTPGKHTLYWNTGPYTYHLIRLIAGGSTGDLVYVNSVTLYKLTTPTVTLETCTGTTVKTIPVYARGQDRITYAIEWFGMEETCYRVCLEGVDDTEYNYLENALALSTEGDLPIELEDGSGFLKWFG